VTEQRANQKYDRDFLLSPEKRNQLVELWEVDKYGRDCFNDPNHVHLYGLAPKDWYARGVRILARTCLEAVKDPLGNKIGSDIAEVVTPATSMPKILRDTQMDCGEPGCPNDLVPWRRTEMLFCSA
jgi:hypothetical protein